MQITQAGLGEDNAVEVALLSQPMPLAASPSLARRLFAATTCLACLHPGPALAHTYTLQDPAPQPESFDEAFIRGAEFEDAGNYLEAARAWHQAAKLLPSTDEANHQNLYQYIANAYNTAATSDPSVLGEAVAALDAFVTTFAATFPDTTLSPEATRVHGQLSQRLGQEQASPPEPLSQDPPPQEPQDTHLPPPHRDASPPPYKPLQIAGGVTTTLGVVMLGVFVGSLVRTKSFERQYDDTQNGCPTTLDNAMGTCQGFLDSGKRASALATASVILAPALLGTGIALLVVAARRKAKHNKNAMSLTPLLSPTTAGLAWQGRF